MYMAQMKQYMKAPMGSDAMRQLPMIGLEGFWRDDKGPKPGPLAEKEEAGRKVLVTSLSYPKDGMMSGYQVDLSIDKETGLPTRFNVSREGKSEGGANYTELLLDPPLKAEDFKFTPPAGASYEHRKSVGLLHPLAGSKLLPANRFQPRTSPARGRPGLVVRLLGVHDPLVVPDRLPRGDGGRPGLGPRIA